MKRLVLIFIVFFAAVAVSPFLIGEKGYILIAMGDITIESTVVTAMIFLVVFFIALILFFKTLRQGVLLGSGTWRKVTTAGKRKAERQFKQGVSAYLLDDYEQAEQLLVKSADNSSMTSVAYAIAAVSARHQGSTANTEYYLDCLGQQLESNPSLEQVLVIIKQQVALNNYPKARLLLDEYHKHIGHEPRLLALEIEVSLTEQRFEHVVELLPKAHKAKSLPDSKLYRWDYEAYLGCFSGLMTQGDQSQLLSYWKGLARKLKQKEAIVLAYCHVLAKHQLSQALDELLLPALKYDADEHFVKQLRRLPISQCQSLINQVQKHLHKDSNNPKWLSLLGFLAFSDKQFDMSAKVYASLVQQLHHFDKEDALIYSKVLMAKGEQTQANQLLLKYLSSDTLV